MADRAAAVTLPRRIQRRRTKGWRMPAGAICVTRPGPFGNPFDWRLFGRDLAVDFFRAWLDGTLSAAERASTGADLEGGIEHLRQLILAATPSLRGKTLVCWCAPNEPCHADVLLELANR